MGQRRSSEEGTLDRLLSSSHGNSAADHSAVFAEEWEGQVGLRHVGKEPVTAMAPKKGLSVIWQWQCGLGCVEALSVFCGAHHSVIGRELLFTFSGI